MKIDSEKLLECIGQVGDDLVLESENEMLNALRVRRRVYQWTSLAAVFVMAAMIFSLYFFLPANQRMGTENAAFPAPMADAMPPHASPAPEDQSQISVRDAGGTITDDSNDAPEAYPDMYLWGVQETPFVEEEQSALIVHGFGGWVEYHRGTDHHMPWIYLAGTFPVAQLENEVIEGMVHVTQDSWHITFTVARNQVIYERTGDTHGTLEGPGISFEYIEGIGAVNIAAYPFEFDNIRLGTDFDPLGFDFGEESAVELARMVREVTTLVSDYLNP
jgi:hypothetical protein